MRSSPKRILVTGSVRFIGDVSVTLSPLPVDLSSAGTLEEIRERLKEPPDAVIYDDDSFGLEDARMGLVRRSKRPVLVVSSRKQAAHVLKAEKLGAFDYVIRPYNQREFIARVNAAVYGKKRVTCLGGGTGLFTLLMGLKSLPNVLLTSIVSMTDDGGSSGRLRSEFGILPPGDIRRSLVALSNAPEFMNEVMQYRFDKGQSLKGHSFGNLFLTALANLKGSMAEAVRGLGDILNIQGIVLPAAATTATLCAMFEDGSVVRGESKIDLAEERHPSLRIRKIWHEPSTECDRNAYASIMNSDIVTIGPGDLFTSLITNFLTRHIRDAVVRTRAKKIYICNLMTKPGETAGFSAVDHVREIVRYLKGDFLDYVIISNTRVSDKAILEYARNNQSPVEARHLDKIRSLTRAEIVLADVGHEQELVRHDSAKLTHEIDKIIQKEGGDRKWH